MPSSCVCRLRGMEAGRVFTNCNEICPSSTSVLRHKVLSSEAKQTSAYRFRTKFDYNQPSLSFHKCTEVHQRMNFVTNEKSLNYTESFISTVKFVGFGREYLSDNFSAAAYQNSCVFLIIFL